MGVGRRMKKQGPPEPFDEAKFAVLKKRKAAEPVHNARGKKRSASGEVLKNGRKGSANEPMMSGALAVRPSSNGVQRKGAKSKREQPGKSVPPPPAKRPKSKALPVIANGDESDDDFSSEPNGVAIEQKKLEGQGEDLESADDLDEEEIDLDNGDFMDSGSDVVDSDEEGKRPFVFSDDEDDEDGEERLTAANMETLSGRLDVKKAQEEAEAQMELEESAMQTNIDGERPDVLEDEFSDGDDGGAKTKLRLAPNLQLLRTRITDTVRVLEDFKKLAQPGRSRAEYTAQFLKDVSAYYGYSPFLAEKLSNLFSPREAFDFFEANESPRPVIIRTNTLKTHRRELAQALISRGVTLEPASKWSKVGLTVFESAVPLGATPEYLAGHYLIQAQSSFLPVMALAPQEGERVLDMAAAPGGKTTHMAALMRNTGAIFANDANKKRAKGLIGNVHRLGATNVIVCSYDARAFPTVIGGFDRVLLDAPCSGTGVIAKDASVKTNRGPRDFMQLPHLQKQLLLAAIDSVDHASAAGAVVVYSTCSVAVEENEQVVQYALRKRPNVRLVDTGLPIGLDGFVSYMGKAFDPDMRLTRRYYPHTYNVDGFFVAKLRKTGPTPANAIRATAPGLAAAATAVAANQAAQNGARAGHGPDDGDDDDPAQGSDEPGEFGGWDDDEDQKYMDRAKKRTMRRKGMDPKALKPNKANGAV